MRARQAGGNLASQAGFTGSDPLDNAGGAHAGTDAHRHHAVLAAGTLQAMRDGGDPDGAGGAERMAEGNGAAERIDLGRIDAEFLHHRQRLGGEGFVQLDPVEVVLLDADLGQYLRDGGNRADAHDFRRHPPTA